MHFVVALQVSLVVLGCYLQGFLYQQPSDFMSMNFPV